MGSGSRGKKLTKKHKENLSRAIIGSKNPNWKGEKVGYTALHEWIKRRIKKPDLCECCKKRRSIDLSNKSEEYKRDLSDWEWICRSCHMIKDGRMEALHKSNWAEKELEIVKENVDKPLREIQNLLSRKVSLSNIYTTACKFGRLTKEKRIQREVVKL